MGVCIVYSTCSFKCMLLQGLGNEIISILIMYSLLKSPENNIMNSNVLYAAESIENTKSRLLSPHHTEYMRCTYCINNLPV